MRRAHYMLRRTLPIWKPHEALDEALDYCRRHDVGEVIWKIEPEDFSHGHPSHGMIGEYLPWLEKARDMLGEYEILSSINPWVTLNHADRGRNQRAVYPDWRWMVDASGKEGNACACPLSEPFLAWLAEAYRLYASTKPHVLWLEDDMRTHHHPPVTWGCYCDAHMQALSERLGRSIDREELVRRLTAPGAPDSVRPIWFQVLGESMVGVARAVAQAVSKENPDTHLGLMCSLSVDGAWWPDALKELGVCAEPLARPGLGPYAEGRPADLFLDRFLYCKQVRCLPEGTRLAPELENYPYTPYSKSARLTRLMLAVGQMLGAAEVTMNLYDHVGTLMAPHDRYGAILKEVKPALDALAEVCGPGGVPRGVGMPFRKDLREFAHQSEGDGLDFRMSQGEGWAGPVQGAGMPAVWDDRAGVMAFTGETIRGYAQEEVRAFLSRGMLLDASALSVLEEMGFGALLGVRSGEWIDKNDRPLSAEEWHDPAFGGAPGKYLTFTRMVPGERLNLIEPQEGARVISHCVNPDRERMLPCFTAFENELGGRTAVYPFDASRGFATGFMNWTRRDQLAAVVRWLGRGKVDLVIEGGAWTLPFRRDYDSYVFVGVMNLELDDWDTVTIRMSWADARMPGTVRALDASGRRTLLDAARCALSDGELSVDLKGGVKALDFTAIVIDRG